MCPECEKMFRPWNHKTKFCSNECRLIALHRSRKLGLR